VDKAAAEDARAVLSFCMKHNLSIKDLERLSSGVFKEMWDDYRQKLNDKQRELITDIVSEWKMPETDMQAHPRSGDAPL